MNSKIINTVEDQDQCELIAKNSQYPEHNSLGFREKQNRNTRKDRHEANLDTLQNRVFKSSDILLELEFVKHDLNQQIFQVKSQQRETTKYKRQFNDLEEATKYIDQALRIQKMKSITDGREATLLIDMRVTKAKILAGQSRTREALKNFNAALEILEDMEEKIENLD